MDLLRSGRASRCDILTRNAFENAIAGVAATGGSTNAVLHLLAMAREAGVALDIDDFQTVSERTPILADLKPSGRFVAADVHAAGGIRLLASRLLGLGLLHGDASRSPAEPSPKKPRTAHETPGQEVIVPADKPLKKSGGLVILHGNLAPEGCVIKLTGHERLSHTGPARVFESEEDAMEAVTAKSIHAETSSSSATKARAAVPACARCSASPRPSSAKASATASLSSPTAASAAPPADSCSATSRRKPRSAAPSPPSTTATPSPSTSPPARSHSMSIPPRSISGWPPCVPKPPTYRSGVYAKYTALVSLRIAGRGYKSRRGSGQQNTVKSRYPLPPLG